MVGSGEICTQMKPSKTRRDARFPIKLLTVALAFTAFFFLVSAWHDWQSFQDFRNVLTQELRLQQLSGSITHLDEVLTMSARQAAATGDARWEQRYREAAPKLDAVIEEARQLGHDPRIEQAAVDTDSANIALVAMENRAFDLERQGQLKAAAAVLDSAEYDKFKKAYSDGLNRIAAALRARTEERLARWRSQMLFAISSAFVGIPVSLVAWLAVLRAGRRYIAELQRTQEELRQAHAEVETRVEARTRELARTHESLEQSEKRYRTLFESSSDALMTLSDKGFLDCNAATVRMFGCKDQGEFIGLHPSEISPPQQQWGQDSRPAADQKIATAFEKGMDQFEWTHRRQNGEDFPAEVLLTAFELGGQRILQATVRDLTERKKAEDWLRLQDNALRAAANAIVITDREGSVLSANPAFTALTGYSAEEVIGRNLRVLKSGKNDRSFYEHLWQTVLAGETWRGELINRRKDGSLYSEEMTITPVRDATGQVGHLISMKQDITDRKRAEAELQQAKEAAEAASQAKGDFLATMSHEIRTPMNGIIGMTGLLLDTPLGREQREHAETVRGSAEALLIIINDILDFAKIEAGRMTIEPIPCNLRDIVEEVAEMMAAKAEERGLDLVVRYAPDAPWRIVGDPGRIRQVLTNLAGNAIKFTEHGHVLIDVECEHRTGSEARLRVSVEDTGIGIPAEKFGQLFERFTQADASTTRRYGGTGLGLAISKQLVELMGGRLSVTSQPGEGSSFSIVLTLPLDAQAPTTSTSVTVLKGLRALVVDDNAVNRRVLDEQVTSFGMRTQCVASGQAALDAMREGVAAGDPFRIAVIDFQMPSMDGEMLGHTIQSEPALRDTVMVMLTSLGHGHDAARLCEMGFAARLVKPVRASQLASVLATAWVARRGLTTEKTAVAAAPVRTAPTAEPVHQFPARVLVAEDNATNQKVAARMLEKLGCRVDVAANGREAVEMLGRLPYDIVFMDCQMPEMDGFAATAEIHRRQGDGHRTPIIAMTANAMLGDRERCLAAGMDDYVSKPVRAKFLLLALQRWLAPTPTSVTGAPTAPTADTPPYAAVSSAALVPAALVRLRGLVGEGDGSL